MSTEISSNTNRRIVFMGTPEFAVASLDALVNNGYSIAGVITAPDKLAGRGMKMHESAVKQFALSKSLHVLQPEKLKNPEFLHSLQDLQAELFVVVAFRMLPQQVWSMPPLGTINLHGSLLPQYRGAAPINWSIINGESETGVTTFRLQHEIDTGNILLQEKISIGENQTAGELHDTMKVIGAKLLTKTVKGIFDGTLKEKPQADFEELKSGLKHAPKIFTETCKIDWSTGTEKIHNLIRGLSPFPGAFTFIQEKLVKIYRSEKLMSKINLLPGEFTTDKKTFLRFATTDGQIDVKELQMEGKRKMLVDDFLRGYRID